MIVSAIILRAQGPETVKDRGQYGEERLRWGNKKRPKNNSGQERDVIAAAARARMKK